MGSAQQVAAVALLVLATAAAVNAHAGHFHVCPDTPEARGYVRREVGNCTAFTTLNATANITMTGKVILWLYAYQNCSDYLSTALQFDTKVYQNGIPLAATNTTGYAYTGLLDSATRAIYVDNATLGTEDPDNIIFWKPTATQDDGSFCGTAANAIVLRSITTGGATEPQPLQSFVLSTTDAGPAVGCNLNLYAKPPLTDLTSQSSPCNSPPPSPRPSPPPPPPPSPGAAAGPRASLAAAFAAAASLVLALVLA